MNVLQKLSKLQSKWGLNFDDLANEDKGLQKPPPYDIVTENIKKADYSIQNNSLPDLTPNEVMASLNAVNFHEKFDNDLQYSAAFILKVMADISHLEYLKRDHERLIEYHKEKLEEIEMALFKTMKLAIESREVLIDTIKNNDIVKLKLKK